MKNWRSGDQSDKETAFCEVSKHACSLGRCPPKPLSIGKGGLGVVSDQRFFGPETYLVKFSWHLSLCKGISCFSEIQIYMMPCQSNES